MQVADLVNVHNERGKIYAFLSNIYLMKPDDNFYKLLSDILPQLKKLSSNDNINRGVTLLDKFLQERANIAEDEAKEFELNIQRKYATIFCLPNVAPAEESFYTSKEHLLNEASHDDMIRLFRKYQLSLDKKSGLYYDNISVEFQFMSHLAYISSDSISDDAKYQDLLQEQLDFHINHFDKWVNEFFNKILFACGEEELLYRSLVYITSGYLYEDKFLLKEFLS